MPVGTTRNRQEIHKAEHDEDLNAKKVIDINALVPKAYDYIGLTYVSSGNGVGEIETVIYKTGGSGGTTVATLTLAYDVSNNISSITRS